MSNIPLSQRAMPQANPTGAVPGCAAYLDRLNVEQRRAVEATEGPVLMLAGAGTGKTKALTARIAHLIATQCAYPSSILAVTFTNKAAHEMKQRVASMMDEGAQPLPWMGTFHSICVKMLRRHAELVGLKSNFTILDTDDQLRLMKQLLSAHHIDDKRWPARLLAGVIDGWKNRALVPSAIPSEDAAAFNGRGQQLYAAYQTRLRELNAVDFGDLLLHVITILKQHGDLLAQYQNRFRYILVDEYQDTNVAQYLWLRLLASGHKNICCVGDDDQSIYGWRGAEVGNILRFEQDFPGATVVRLEQNYRSTSHILGAASCVISGNEKRLGKTLWTERGDGEKLRLIGLWDAQEEARWVGEDIEDLHRARRGEAEPVPFNHIAILVRASHQMRAFEDRFLSIALPYKVIGGPRFYERKEVRDAIAYFRLAVSFDDDLAFERIVNLPKRGVGKVALQTIQSTARERKVPLFESTRLLCAEQGLSGKAGKELARFVQLFERWHQAIRGGLGSHIELAQEILEESGYVEMWQNDKTPDAAGRLENLKELVNSLEEFDNLPGFLEHVSLVMETATDNNEPKVSIMTLHAAKGLEFPVVYLAGWEEGLFPSQRSLDESGQRGLEEERRLAYVGITRAEQLCTISFASNRQLYGQWQSSLPSQFIDELPEAHVEVLSQYGREPQGSYQRAASPLETQTAAAYEASSGSYSSPGWSRMAASKSKATPHLKSAKSTTIEGEVLQSISLGDRVFHQKFGYGFVVTLEGEKARVDFEKTDGKQVMVQFLERA